MYSSFLKAALVAACVAPGLSACASVTAAPPEGDQRGRVIHADEIQKSGARDAWEVLQRSGTNFSLSQTPTGEPTGIRSRGRSSVYLTSLPIVIVDGARLVDFRSLRQVPAAIIERMHILNGVEGTRYFGTGGGNGVIVVHTTAGVHH